MTTPTGRHGLPTVASGGPGQPNPDGVIRRTRRRPFIPPSPDTGPAVVSRELLSRDRSRKSQLSRNRKIAGDLPAWDPLPPGEVVIHRGVSQDGR